MPEIEFVSDDIFCDECKCKVTALYYIGTDPCRLFCESCGLFLAAQIKQVYQRRRDTQIKHRDMNDRSGDVRGCGMKQVL